VDEPLLGVTAHPIDGSTLVVVQVRDAAIGRHEELGRQLRKIVDEVPEASVVIVHGTAAATAHEPAVATLAAVGDHGRARGVVVRGA
jgi:hypothetical protein